MRGLNLDCKRGESFDVGHWLLLDLAHHSLRKRAVLVLVLVKVMQRDREGLTPGCSSLIHSLSRFHDCSEQKHRPGNNPPH